MSRAFWREALTRPFLAEKIFLANGYGPPPAPPGTAPETWAALLACPRARRRLAAASGPRPGLGWWDFGEESWRLALLPPQLLEELLLTFGAAVAAPRLVRLIRAEEVLAVRRELGDQLYHYVLRRGQYQLGSVRDFFPSPPGAGRLRRPALLAVGRRALAICGHGWPPRLARALDLPEPAALAPAARAGVWFWLKNILLREVAPEWRPAFN